MTPKFSAVVTLLLILLSACAQFSETRANVAGNEYLGCVNRAAEGLMDNPAGAEQIAAAAHAQCWSEWSSYRERTQADYTSRAQTPEEMQLARDKADAYLRQFETDARRAVMSRVVERTYRVPATR